MVTSESTTAPEEQIAKLKHQRDESDAWLEYLLRSMTPTARVSDVGRLGDLMRKRLL